MSLIAKEGFQKNIMNVLTRNEQTNQRLEKESDKDELMKCSQNKNTACSKTTESFR